MMRWLLLVLVACSGSTTRDASMPDDASDAGSDASDASTDAGTDAADASDVGVDAPDAGECPINCIRTPLRWQWDGGLAATRNRYEVSECARVLRTTDDLLGGSSEICIEYVDATQCALVDPVEQLLRDPDVVSARAAAPVVYGIDSRPSDGAVFAITIGDDLIEVGGSCEGAPGCAEIPGGVAALQDALLLMQAQVDESDACAAPLEDPATFECSVQLGDATTQCLVGDEYCFSPFACRPTPSSCGGPATCACVGEGFPCSEEDGAVTVVWTD